MVIREIRISLPCRIKQKRYGAKGFPTKGLHGLPEQNPVAEIRTNQVDHSKRWSIQWSTSIKKTTTPEVIVAKMIKATFQQSTRISFDIFSHTKPSPQSLALVAKIKACPSIWSPLIPPGIKVDMFGSMELQTDSNTTKREQQELRHNMGQRLSDYGRGCGRHRCPAGNCLRDTDQRN